MIIFLIVLIAAVLYVVIGLKNIPKFSKYHFSYRFKILAFHNPSLYVQNSLKKEAVWTARKYACVWPVLVIRIWWVNHFTQARAVEVFDKHMAKLDSKKESDYAKLLAKNAELEKRLNLND